METKRLDRVAVAFSFVLAGVIAACSDAPPSAPIVSTVQSASAAKGGVTSVARVEVSVSPTSVSVGATAQAVGVAKDRKGNTLTGSTFSWSTSDAKIATVSSGGVVTAKASGSVSVTALVDGVKGSATMTVAGTTATATSTAGFAIAVQPSETAQSGIALSRQPVVQLIDGAGASVAAAGVVVTATVAGGGSLSGGLAATTNSQGVATFAGLTITGSGTHTLTFSASSLPSATSRTISVASGVATTGVQPLLLEDFSSYATAADLLANTSGRWVIGGRSSNPDRIVIDATKGYGTSTRSMRYDWPNNGLACTYYQIKPGFLTLPPGLTHVWIEYVVRFSTNFSTHTPGAPNCGDAYKLGALYSMTSAGVDGSRWDFSMHSNRWETSGPSTGAPPENSFVTNPSALWDGQPHVFRYEIRTDPVGTTSIYRAWVDGVLVVNRSGFRTSSLHTEIAYFSPGLNMNEGPGISGMQMWWHKIAVFGNNPGW